MTPCSGTASRALRCGGVLALACALSGLGSLAQAQPNAEIAAQALFDEGLALMDKGRYAEACPKLAESQRLDPGGGTLLNLAICHEKQGKLASAYTEYKGALGIARADGKQERVKYASEHAEALRPRLRQLTVHVSAQARLPGLEVTMDGVPITESTWGVALPADPGKHVVRASAHGFETSERTVTVTGEATKAVIEIPVLVPSAANGPGEGAGAAEPDRAARREGTGSVSARTSLAPTTPADAAPGNVQQTAGYVIGATGIVATILGAVFGGLAIAKHGESSDLCDAEICPNTEDGRTAVDLNDQARTNATLSNAFVGAGLGLLGVGLVVLLTAPSSEPSATPRAGLRLVPVVTPSSAALGAKLAW
jgi:hypothetical protein